MTDDQHILAAARYILAAENESEYDAACAEMVEVLRYAKSIEWWEQFECKSEAR